MIGVWAPGIVLAIIAALTADSAIRILRMYNLSREPAVLHSSLTFFYIAVSFAAGSLGVLFEFNQLTHPIFDVVLITLSMSYLSIGFIYQSLSAGVKVRDQYLIVLLAIAPFNGLALLLGLQFIPAVEILSQMIPLILLIFLELSLIRRIRHTTGEHAVLRLLKLIFWSSLVMHSIGIISMIIFSFMFATGYESQLQNFWGSSWESFDYFYFGALLSLLALISWISRLVRDIPVEDTDLSQVINSLLE